MGQLTLSSKLAHTMAKFFVLSLLVAVGQAAPHVYPAGVSPLAHAGLAASHALGYAAAPVAAHGLGYAAAPVAAHGLGYAAPVAAHALGYAAAPAHIVGTSVQEHIHAGPAVAHTTHEVVGHKTVQVGTQAVQTGHTYTQHAEVSQAPAYTYVAEPAKTSQSTVPIAPPVLPAAPAPYFALPPAPTNQGPAPADTVTITRIAAPVRTHTVITPQVTRIEPELEVKKYIGEVPVAVPVPVEREVIVLKHVAKPYPVEVPQPYAVPQPYKVHPVHKVVETPVIDQHHITVHQPIAVAHHAVAAPALHAGAYAHHAVAAPTLHAGAYAQHAVASPVAVHAAAYQPALHAGAYAHHAGYPIVAAPVKA